MSNLNKIANDLRKLVEKTASDPLYLVSDEVSRVGLETSKLGNRINQLEDAFNKVGGEDSFRILLSKKSKNPKIREVCQFLLKKWWAFIGDRFFKSRDAAKEFVVSYDEGASRLASIQGLFKRQDQAMVGKLLELADSYHMVAERFIKELPRIKSDIIELYASVNWGTLVPNPAWSPENVENDKRKFKNLVPYAHSLREIEELKFILRSIINMHRKNYKL